MMALAQTYVIFLFVEGTDSLGWVEVKSLGHYVWGLSPIGPFCSIYLLFQDRTNKVDFESVSHDNDDGKLSRLWVVILQDYL